MRDDLFSFTFRGHRVCVWLNSSSPLGWSFSIDGDEEAPPPVDVTFHQRLLLEDAGTAARDRIRIMEEAPVAIPLDVRLKIATPTPEFV